MGIELEIINPEGWDRPRGYANGIVAPAGSGLLFIAGQIGWNAKQVFESDNFGDQFDQALANVIEVVHSAGGSASNLARLVVYVTDKREYVAQLERVGAVWRTRLGKHFPTMALVEVKGLLEDAAKVEIEGIAVLPAE